MKQLVLDSLALGKSVLLLREPLELYVLLGANGAVVFLAGLVLGHCSLLQEREMKITKQRLKEIIRNELHEARSHVRTEDLLNKVLLPALREAGSEEWDLGNVLRDAANLHARQSGER